MYIPQHLDGTRAFIKKAFQFIKYYPLKYKDPTDMLRKTLIKLENVINDAKDLSDLEPLSTEAKMMVTTTSQRELCQIKVEGEEHLWIVYQPAKFLGSVKDKSKVACLYDLIYLSESDPT